MSAEDKSPPCPECVHFSGCAAFIRAGGRHCGAQDNGWPMFKKAAVFDDTQMRYLAWKIERLRQQEEYDRYSAPWRD